MGKFNVLLVFRLFWSFGVLSAQQSDSLQEVIISATRTPQDMRLVSRNMTVLRSEELQRFPVVNVADALKMVEGIYTVGAGQTPGQLQTLFMQGAAGNQTTILIDGVRLYDPASTDASTDLSELSLLDVDRVEIVKGGHSAMYGSAALGGSINIITKKSTKKGWSGTAEQQLGTFGNSTLLSTSKLSLNWTSAKGFYINSGGWYQYVKGLDATLDTVTTLGVFKNRDRDNFEKTDIFTKAGYDGKNWKAYLGWRMSNQFRNIDDGAYQDDANSITQLNRHFFHGGLEWNIHENTTLNYLGAWTRILRNSVDDSSFIAPNVREYLFSSNQYKGNFLNQELQITHRQNNIRYLLGLFFQQERMSDSIYLAYTDPSFPFFLTENLDSLNLHANTTGLFAQIEWEGKSIGVEPLRMVVSGRYAHHSTFGNVFTYTINPSWTFSPKWSVYASFNKGFNAPSLYQLYSPNRDYSSQITRGNPTLRPETSLFAEIGLKYRSEKLQMGVNFFQNTIQNTIQYVYLWKATNRPDTISFLDYRGDTYLNAGKQTITGTSLNALYKICPSWSLGGNIAYQYGDLSIASNDVSTAHVQNYLVQLYNSASFLNKSVSLSGLVRRPMTANVFLDFQTQDRWQVRLSAFYAGPRQDVFYDGTLPGFGGLATKEVNSYSLLDLSGRYKMRENLAISLRLENILNTSYSEILGYSTRGRSVYAGVQWNF